MWQFQKEIEISWCDKQIVHNLVSLVLYLLLVKSFIIFWSNMFHRHISCLIFLVEFFVEGENTFLCCLFSDNFLYKKLSFDNKNTSIFPEEASLRKKVSILVAQLFNDLHKTLLVMAKDVEGIVQAPLTSRLPAKETSLASGNWLQLGGGANDGTWTCQGQKVLVSTERVRRRRRRGSACWEKVWFQ